MIMLMKIIIRLLEEQPNGCFFFAFFLSMEYILKYN